jgi:hypothetical protein
MPSNSFVPCDPCHIEGAYDITLLSACPSPYILSIYPIVSKLSGRSLWSSRIPGYRSRGPASTPNAVAFSEK